MPENFEYTTADLVRAARKAFVLSERDFFTFMELQEKLEAWEKKFLNKLVQERASYFREHESISAVLASRQWGYAVHETLPESVPFLPPGYQLTQQGADCFELRQQQVSAEIIGTYATETQGINAAALRDKELDPYRWRKVSDGCPDNMLLLFSSVDFPAVVPPVKQGYRQYDKIHLFGGSWLPTHWCYLPEGPSKD